MTTTSTTHSLSTPSTTTPKPRSISKAELLEMLREPRRIQDLAAQLGVKRASLSNRLRCADEAVFDRARGVWRLRTPQDPPLPRHPLQTPRTPAHEVKPRALALLHDGPKTIAALEEGLGVSRRRLADRLGKMPEVIFDKARGGWRLRTPQDPAPASKPRPALPPVDADAAPAPPLRAVMSDLLADGPKTIGELGEALGLQTRRLARRLHELSSVIFDAQRGGWRLRTPQDPAPAKALPRAASPDPALKVAILGWLAIHKAAMTRTIQEQPWGKRPYVTLNATLRQLVSEGKLVALRKGVTAIYHLPTPEAEREAGRLGAKVRGRPTGEEMEADRVRVLALAQRDGAVTSVGVQAELGMLPARASARLRELEDNGRLTSPQPRARNARQVFALPGVVADLRAVAVSLARQTGGVSALEVAAHMGLAPAQVAHVAQQEAQAWGVEVVKVGARVVLRAERPARA